MKEQVLELLNNELVGYIIEVLAIFFSVVGGMFLLIKKVKEVLDRVIALFKDANANSETTNNNLKTVAEDNKKVRKEVREIEENIFTRLEAVEKQQQEQFERQESILKEYISQQTTLLKLPEAFAEMVCCTPDQVRNGTAKRVCDKLGMNDSNVKKEEEQVNGGE